MPRADDILIISLDDGPTWEGVLDYFAGKNVDLYLTTDEIREAKIVSVIRNDAGFEAVTGFTIDSDGEGIGDEWTLDIADIERIHLY